MAFVMASSEIHEVGPTMGCSYKVGFTDIAAEIPTNIYFFNYDLVLKIAQY